MCVFPQVTPVLERMLAALRVGAPHSALEVVASAGTTRRLASAEVDALLESVSGALLPDDGRDAAPIVDSRAIVIDGDGTTASRLQRLLREAGHRVLSIGEIDDERDEAAAAAIIASYVIPPWRHGPWLRRDIPHLPIVFGDAGAEIGPFVDGDGPCLRCLSLARTDADPAWPALATQLDTLPPASEPTLLSAQVASIAAGWLDAAVRSGDRSHASTSVHVDPSGRISSTLHSPHGMCGCRGLPENVTALVGRPRSRPSSASIGVSRA